MKISLVHLAAMATIYGRASHGLSSVAGTHHNGRRALRLLRWHFTNDTRPILFNLKKVGDTPWSVTP